jgi:heparan-alpha-glucosaminide N-acetyltransferase
MNSNPTPNTLPRLASLDAYRGFIMFLMASGGLGIGAVAKAKPGTFWETIAPQVDHVAWTGCVLWDLIQPAFMFMVGAAAAFSTAKRLKQGDSFLSVLGHAWVRSIALVLLGVLLASNSSDAKQTNWVFTNVLAQIGLGYFFLILLTRTSWRWQVAAVAAILVGYWLLFALWPVHPAPEAANADWPEMKEWQTGFFAHWNPHANAAADFDRRLLNLFPRAEPYIVGRGGYQTLNFVPSLATMLLGLLAGNLLRSDGPPAQKAGWLLLIGLALWGAGTIAGLTVCPIVKRIWTPSWTLYSGGWVFAMLAAFFWLIDVMQWQKWSLPWTVIGMNSIFVYLGFQLSSGWIRNTFARHFGWLGGELERLLQTELFSGPYQQMAQRAGVLLVLWLLAWWLYRQRVFLRL